MLSISNANSCFYFITCPLPFWSCFNFNLMIRHSKLELGSAFIDALQSFPYTAHSMRRLCQNIWILWLYSNKLLSTWTIPILLLCLLFDDSCTYFFPYMFNWFCNKSFISLNSILPSWFSYKQKNTFCLLRCQHCLVLDC